MTIEFPCDIEAFGCNARPCLKGKSNSYWSVYCCWDF